MKSASQLLAFALSTTLGPDTLLPSRQHAFPPLPSFIPCLPLRPRCSQGHRPSREGNSTARTCNGGKEVFNGAGHLSGAIVISKPAWVVFHRAKLAHDAIQGSRTWKWGWLGIDLKPAGLKGLPSRGAGEEPTCCLPAAGVSCLPQVARAGSCRPSFHSRRRKVVSIGAALRLFRHNPTRKRAHLRFDTSGDRDAVCVPP